MALDGKVAIVTGAGRNIGRDVALVLARDGAAIGVVDLDKDLAESVVREVEAIRGPGSAVALACDVTDEGAVADMVSHVVAQLGRVDILVNNVGATDRGKTILDLSVGEWQRVFDICVTSAFLCGKWVARRLVEQGEGGVIVNIGSTSGYLGRDNALAYPVAKSALFGLTKSMARQLGPHGVRVSLVAPNRAGSPVGESEFNPQRSIVNLIGRPVEPVDIANAVRFMVSPEASAITGVDLLVDGGSILAVAG